MPRLPRPRAARSLVLLVAILVSACSGAATAAPSAPPAPAATPAITAASATLPATPAPTAAPTDAPAPTAAPTPTAAPVATPVATPDAFPMTVTGFDGTSVTIPARPARIVSLTPATTEILFAVGVADLIVARSEDPTPYPAEAAAIPAVTSMMAVDVEKIVALQPDLVIAGGLGFTSTEAIAKLRTVGIPVLVVYAPDVAGVLSDVRLTARVAGAGAEGEALAAWMKAEIDAIATTAGSTASRPRVFYEIDASGDIYGPADSSFLAEMVRLAGGDPVTTGSPDVYAIPLERLIEADPEIILLGDAAYGTTAEIVMGRAGWGAMTAVKEKAIRPVEDVVVTRPGPRLVDGLRVLALAINPAAVLPDPNPAPVATVP